MSARKKVSDKQLVANRRNATKSTGPRTPAGKAKSRWNALKHGVLSHSVIPYGLEPFESREDFEAMLSALQEDLQPQTALEEMLVERIATAHWRMGRILRAEAGAIARKRLSMDHDLQLAEIRADPVNNPFRGALQGPLPDPLSRQLADMWAMMDDFEELRSHFGAFDPKWTKVSDGELLAHAQKELRRLQDALCAERCDITAAEQDLRSIPDIDLALDLARYESSLDRDIHRALSALERLQRRRQGEYVPPPIDVTLTAPAPEHADA